MIEAKKSGSVVVFEDSSVLDYSVWRNVGKWDSKTGEIEVFSGSWFKRQQEVIKDENAARKFIISRWSGFKHEASKGRVS